MMWILLTFHPIQARKRAGITSIRRRFRNRFRFSVCHGGRAHQWLLGNHPIDQWYEHRYADGHLRDLFVAGWTAPNYQVLAPHDWRRRLHCRLDRGATSQDLRPATWSGPHPSGSRWFACRVTVSTLAIGTTLNLMNKGWKKYIPTPIPVAVQALPSVSKSTRTLHLPR